MRDEHRCDSLTLCVEQKSLLQYEQWNGRKSSCLQKAQCVPTSSIPVSFGIVSDMVKFFV